MKRLAARAVPLLGLALIAAGCGGGQQAGGEESSGSAGAPPKAQFIKQADKICTEADNRQDRMRGIYLKKHANAEASQAGQIELVAEAALPPIDQEVAKLAKLELPAEGAAEVEALVGELEKRVGEADEDPKAVVEGNWSLASVEKRAKKFGFNACATPS